MAMKWKWQILAGFAAVLVMAALAFLLAQPCNGDYGFSLSKLEFECKQLQVATPPVGAAPDTAPDPAQVKLIADIDAILKVREGLWRSAKFKVTQTQSCTRGVSGGRIRAKLEVNCPAGTVKIGTANLVRTDGGCYGPKETPTGATGTVSQTGKGRSVCALSVTCGLDDAVIASKLQEDKFVLGAVTTQENLLRLKDTLAPIKLSEINIKPVNCY